jgi:hypothetical protein
MGGALCGSPRTATIAANFVECIERANFGAVAKPFHGFAQSVNFLPGSFGRSPNIILALFFEGSKRFAWIFMSH